MSILYYESPVGWLAISEQDGKIFRLKKVEQPGASLGRAQVLEQCVVQLQEYFARERTTFDLPLFYAGTPFQVKAWEQLLCIPYGTTISYAEQAKAIGHDKAFRAVGSANGANPLPIIIPCHRVLGSQGKTGGYAYGLEMKEYLLKLEGAQIRK